MPVFKNEPFSLKTWLSLNGYKSRYPDNPTGYAVKFTHKFIRVMYRYIFSKIESLFIIQPHLDSPLKTKAKLFIRCFFLLLLVRVAGALAISISNLLGLKEVLTVIGHKSKLSDFYTEELSLFLLIILFPVLEELAFRGWFTGKKILAGVSLTVTCFYLFYILLFRWFDGGFGLTLNEKIAVIAFALVLSSIFIFRRIDKIMDIISKRNSLLILISVCAFASIHILNYSGQGFGIRHLLALAVIILPHFFSGYIYTYLRINNGLHWSVALHVVNNSLILIPTLLGKDTF